jgi:hypothetical protein
MWISPGDLRGREGDCGGAVKRLMSADGPTEGTARMSLLLLALLQAAPAPAPEYKIIEQPDGAFGFVVERLSSAKLAETEIELDLAAERHCAGRKAVVAGQNYDQAIDSEGVTSPEITNLRQTYRCEAAAPNP